MLGVVSKRAYDDLLADARQMRDDLRDARARLAEAQRLAAAAMQLLAASQREPPSSALPAPTPAPRPALPVPVRDEVSEAIELSAGADVALSRHLNRWAKQQKLDGVKEHDIIQSIIHWHRANDWDGSEEDAPPSFV